MRILILPENNSPSHIGKSLALESALTAKGHEVFVAADPSRMALIQHLGDRGRLLPDIQGDNHSGYPTVSWFRDSQRLVECIKAEVRLLKELKPDRVLGVFRFTLKASAHLAEVPFDSLACGCMLPETPDVLGFAEGENGIDRQRALLKSFYGITGAQLSRGLQQLGLEPISDIRIMLKGERTFLWDFPAFSPLPQLPGVTHVGPIPWSGWPDDGADLSRILESPRPLAVLTFGTCIGSAEVAIRMVKLLRSSGYQVLLAAGGQDDLFQAMADLPDVITCRFAPLHRILPHTALLACHGGQLTVFEALSELVPVLVLPFQAEQAHNGVCLERIGCGQRLTPPSVFIGDPGVYVDAFTSRSDRDLGDDIRGLMENPATPGNLRATKETLAGFHGVETLSSLLVAG